MTRTTKAAFAILGIAAGGVTITAVRPVSGVRQHLAPVAHINALDGSTPVLWCEAGPAPTKVETVKFTPIVGHNRVTWADWVKAADRAGFVRFDVLGQVKETHGPEFADPGTPESTAHHLRAALDARDAIRKAGGDPARWNWYTDIESDHEVRVPIARDVMRVLGVDMEPGGKWAVNFSSFKVGKAWLHPYAYDETGSVVTYLWDDTNRPMADVLAERDHIKREGGRVVWICIGGSAIDKRLEAERRRDPATAGVLWWWPTARGGK